MASRIKFFYQFGEFRFDPEQRVLSSGGEHIPLPPKATDVLAVLLEERGKLVEREHLLNTVWQDTFVEDGNINNAISTLRKTLGGNGIIETVPRRGYRFTADVAKVGEEEIEEIVVEKRTVTQTVFTTAAEPTSLPAVHRRSYLPWALAAGFVLIGLIGAATFLRPTAPGTRPTGDAVRTIAIVPLRPVGDTPIQSTDLGPGITENLASRLGGLSGLTVLSTRSASHLAQTEADPLTIGGRLGADAVLDGSYQSNGGRIRVTARLLNVADGKQIWAGSFDESENDVFLLQDALASQAARSLIESLTLQQERQLIKRSTDDVEAYKLYLRGRHEWSKRTAEGFERSIAAFREAIDRDPSFSLAHAGLADAYALLPDYNIEPPSQAFPKAKAAALRALEIEPDSARPRTTLAYILASYEWNYPEAERQYRAAIEAEPNYATAHQWYGELLYALRRFDESDAALSRAVALDPLVPITLSERAVLLYYKGELDASLAAFAKLKTDHPTFPTSYNFSSWIYGLKGDTRSAFENELTFLRMQGVDDATLAILSDAFETGGHRAFLAKVAERNLKSAGTGAFPQYRFAHVFARLRDREQTLHWIERCVEARSPNIIKIANDKNFDFVHEDPRFQAALARLNFPS
jgi:DNA-binding winged helix-turn-helix (wHTH) protein/TolB-like protein